MLAFNNFYKMQSQLTSTRSCEPPGRVQMHNPGRVHWQNAGNHSILKVSKAS